MPAAGRCAAAAAAARSGLAELSRTHAYPCLMWPVAGSTSVFHVIGHRTALQQRRAAWWRSLLLSQHALGRDTGGMHHQLPQTQCLAYLPAPAPERAATACPSMRSRCCCWPPTLVAAGPSSTACRTERCRCALASGGRAAALATDHGLEFRCCCTLQSAGEEGHQLCGKLAACWNDSQGEALWHHQAAAQACRHQRCLVV